MSARNDVLDAAGQVCAVWRRTRDFIPEELEDAIIDMMRAIDRMNSRCHARRSDPSTSYQHPQAQRMTKYRQMVLAVVQQRPCTDVELVAALEGQMSASGARTRRVELVRTGLLKWSGERRKGPSGRRHKVWQVA